MKIALLFLALAICANADMNICGHGFSDQVTQIIAVTDKVSILGPGKIVQSDLRLPLMKKIESYMKELTADFTNEKIIDYSCNNIQRKTSIAREDARAVDIQTQTNPCVVSLEG